MFSRGTTVYHIISKPNYTQIGLRIPLLEPLCTWKIHVEWDPPIVVSRQSQGGLHAF